MSTLQSDIEARLAETAPDVEVLLAEVVGGHTVRLFIDHPEGVTLDLCERVTHLLPEVREHYTLEVSSPGLDRPLHGEADYRRFVGKLAKLSSYEPVDGRRHWTGRIVACDDGIVTLELVGEKASARVPLSKVSHGRLEVEFPKNG